MDIWVVSSLAIVSNAARNMGLQILEYLLSILGVYIPRSGITGAYDNSMFTIFFEEPP